METFDHIMQYGWPTVALVALAFGAWRIVKFLAPLVKEWLQQKVETERRWREYLDKDDARATKQLEVCGVHAKALTQTGGDVQSLRAAALEGCQLCRTWSQAFPEQKSALCKHIDAMEQIIGETH